MLRVFIAIAFRPVLMFAGDSYVYLRNALKVRPGIYRPSAYSMVLLWPFQHLHALWILPWLQHAIGLGSATLLYLVLRRRGVVGWLATVGTAPMLLDPYVAGIEQYVMSEAIFIALVVAAVSVLLWRPRPSAAGAAAAAALVGAATLTRTVAVVLLVPFAVFLVIRRVEWKPLVAAGVAFVVPLVVYAAWYDARRGHFSLGGQTGLFLYGRVATFADCRGLDVPSYDLVLCDPRPPSERPSANFYIWAKRAPWKKLHRERALYAPLKRDDVLTRFSLRVIEHQPAAYLRTIGGDLAHYLAPWRWVGPQDEPLGMWEFHSTLPYERHIYQSVPPSLAGGRALKGRPVAALAGPLRIYQDFVFTPGVLLAMAVLLAVAGALAEWRRGRRSPGLGLEAVTLAAAGVLVVLFPAATAMFDYRYLLPALALLPPAGVLGAAGRWPSCGLVSAPGPEPIAG